MTNAEKYLKDGVDVGEFWNDFIDYIDEHSLGFNTNNFETFLNDNSKPTLTEDERVILRNIKNVKSIRRDNEGDLVIYKIYSGVYYITEYNHLFQFIKERRRIRNSRTFERGIRMVAEILICVAIALFIILGFAILIKFMLWLDENKGIDVAISTLIVASFIIITFGVWLVRNSIRESKETKLERRRI